MRKQPVPDLTRRSQVPSIEQMNGAFVKAVTLAKGERHAFFNQASLASQASLFAQQSML